MASADAANKKRELRIRLFIAAQVAVPVVATIHQAVTGDESWWGWSMFSR